MNRLSILVFAVMALSFDLSEAWKFPSRSHLKSVIKRSILTQVLPEVSSRSCYKNAESECFSGSTEDEDPCEELSKISSCVERVVDSCSGEEKRKLTQELTVIQDGYDALCIVPDPREMKCINEIEEDEEGMFEECSIEVVGKILITHGVENLAEKQMECLVGKHLLDCVVEKVSTKCGKAVGRTLRPMLNIIEEADSVISC